MKKNRKKKISKKNYTIENVPKIFVSHDTRDKAIAMLFCELLNDASSNSLEIFCSSDLEGDSGIKLGIPWFEEIISNILNASDMICILTDYSINNPWVLYEAGVGFGDKKNHDQKSVVSVLFDLPRKKLQSTPFHSIQNCRYDDESLSKLVINLLKKVPNLKPTLKSVNPHVKLFIENYKKLPKTGMIKRSEDKEEKYIYNIFEELKMMYSRLEKRFDHSHGVSSIEKRMKLNRHMFEELQFISGREFGNPVVILLFFSMFRDKLPWFYELGKEFYFAIKNKNYNEAEKLLHSIRDFGKRFIHSPLSDEYMISNNDRFFYDELMHITEKNLFRYLKQY